VTQEILHAKAAKGLTFAKLAATVGCCPVFPAVVCYRRASTTRTRAEKLLHALCLGADLGARADELPRQRRVWEVVWNPALLPED